MSGEQKDPTPLVFMTMVCLVLLAALIANIDHGRTDECPPAPEETEQAK